VNDVQYPRAVEPAEPPLSGIVAPALRGGLLMWRLLVASRRRFAAARSRFALALLLAASALAGCGRQAELSACNIAEQSCQEDVYYAVVRLRGDGWDPFDGLPPIRTISVEQYRDELTPDKPPQPPDDAPEEPKVDPWDVALQWLGLVTPTMTSGEAAVAHRLRTVAAYYSSSEQRVTVIDRGGDREDRADTILLVHELVHAFQDNEVRGRPVDHTTDGGFAGRALIEGEARMYEELAAAEVDGIAPRGLDWHSHYARHVAHLRSKLAEHSSPFYAVSPFVYDLGADMLMGGWLEGGNAAVRKLGETFPRNAVGYMARHERMELDRAPRIACRVDAPAESFAPEGYDRFGAMQLYAFLSAADMPDGDAWRTALDWRDDVLWVFFDEDSQKVVLSWRIRLANAAAAERVVAAAAQREQLRAERRGNDALIVGSDTGLAVSAGEGDCER
jgi:hypothetical protein